MTRLNFGVADIPYQRKGGETTGQVALKLERRYRIMQRFAYAKDKIIREQLGQAVADGFDRLVSSGRLPPDIFADACSEIENEFRLFLDLRELDGAGDPGIPTLASLRGVNHRLAKPYAKTNPPRASFIDTGQMQASFKVWVEK